MEAKKTKTRAPLAAPAAVVAEALAETFEKHESLPDGPARLDPDFRHDLIRRTAYGIAEQRDFAPGREVDDWLAAEATIDAQLAGRTPGV